MPLDADASFNTHGKPEAADSVQRKGGGAKKNGGGPPYNRVTVSCGWYGSYVDEDRDMQGG